MAGSSFDTDVLMQTSFKSAGSLGELRRGEQGIIERLDLPDDIACRLMELGFLPGNRVTVAESAPGGDPKVFRVDGSEIALRLETASCLLLRGEPVSGD